MRICDVTLSDVSWFLRKPFTDGGKGASATLGREPGKKVAAQPEAGDRAIGKAIRVLSL
jgi:hypothetical protein